MNDLISRAAAIDAFYIQSDDDGWWVGTAQDAETLLNGLPAAEKVGKWIYCEDSMADCVDGYKCDQCGFFVPWDYQHKGIDYINDYHYCPNCGARMERREEDE